MAPRGRRRPQQASVESSDAPTYEENLVERLARSLKRSGFIGVTVDQARRLGAVGFDGSTDPMVDLSWLDERTRKRHTWAQFETAFHTEFFHPAFVETKRLEFETLTQGSMIVSEYERRFRELSNFYPNFVVDEVNKKRRFLDGLSELIALSLSGSDHPTYQ